MTTPSDNTPLSIIEDALLDAKLIQEGQTPSSEVYAQHMRRLRDLVNLEVIKGVKLWLLSDQSINLVEGTGTYTIVSGGSINLTRPLQVLQAYWLSENEDVRREVSLIAWHDYLLLGAPESEGSVNSVMVDKLYDRFRILCWPLPDATDAAGTLHLLLRTQVTQFIELDETIQFPPEWRMFLHWGLAAEICTGQPDQVIQRCEGKAQMAREALEGFDVEDTSVRFEVDMSRGNPQGSFT